MTANNKKILIVDDERPLARALELKLQREGFNTSVAHDGNEAVQAIKDDEYNLILLDLVMLEMDGFQVLSEIGKLGEQPPVVVLSNLGQEEDIERAKELGAVDFFVKSNIPINDMVDYIVKQTESQ